MDIIPEQQPFLQEIDQSLFTRKVARLSMLRLDVIHKHVSGNKWYKLKENIRLCQQKEIIKLLTFGGGYSNHLAATAAMANISGLQSVGVVRGRYDTLTPTLRFCIDNGMQLHFVSFEEYKQKDNPTYIHELASQFNYPFIIPEGGANEEGRVGAEEIACYIPDDFTHITVSVGTGTTMVGIVNATQSIVTGFAPMKGGAYIEGEVKQYIETAKHQSYTVKDLWHFGGFGKSTNDLITFMNEFYMQNNIPLDMVYTAKMMWGVKDCIHKGEYPTNAKILCIHTGGLQGNSSIAEKLIYK